MSSLVSAKGPSMTEVLPPENRTRAPLALDWSPERSTRTPAFISSSLYLAIAARSSSLGILPASLSLLAWTIIMNLTVLSPSYLLVRSRTMAGTDSGWPIRLPASKTNGREEYRQAADIMFGVGPQFPQSGGFQRCPSGRRGRGRRCRWLRQGLWHQ